MAMTCLRPSNANSPCSPSESSSNKDGKISSRALWPLHQKKQASYYFHSFRTKLITCKLLSEKKSFVPVILLYQISCPTYDNLIKRWWQPNQDPGLEFMKLYVDYFKNRLTACKTLSKTVICTSGFMPPNANALLTVFERNDVQQY